MNNQKDNLILEFLGKLVFPKDAPWQRRKKIRVLLFSIWVGLAVGAILVAIAFMMNTKR